ncbi:MAG: FIVAR domain-containing protein [Prevotella sp.]|nr:FIVAR domain-containing protein [Prevotella sp.]
MKTTKRLILTLAAILGMTGAWAQDAEEVAVTKTANNNEWTLTMPASDVELQVEYYMPFDLTLADGSNAHGTVAFTVGDAAATQALKDDVVTVSVTPADGYTVKGVTAKTSSQVVVPMTNGDNGWTFTMPEENVAVTVTYAKNLQDAWIQDIADQTYTGSAIEPTIEVKDGEATLVLNTDYTVAYSNNTNAGEATVTVTAVAGSDYSGTASKTFTIVKADITMTTAPAAVSGLVYSGTAQTLITAGVASFGTVLYSTDGETYAEALPQGTAAGTYTVYYKVEGDANHNAFAAQTLSVTIATDKTALNNGITEAEAYYNSIKDSNPTAAAALQTAINAAKQVKDNANATQTEIETAAQTLNDAVIAAQADVALKRITLVIPAKSYMARIDADKRQIENAVAGVKLYSVKSVTNTEVELTAELSVIAAEMPYFIYNDNDTEIEVSIVVSSSDADNVDYDSEHFKGTLVDKTFTDEDMQEADHYVLSGGSSFVWVKDAGTLSAGKCWIELVPSSAAHARALSIVHEGETTGISSVKTAADTKDAAVYDLQGRRVMQPTKGLFIVNGKKVVTK